MNGEWEGIELWSSRIAAVRALAGALYGVYRAVRATVVKIVNISNRLQTISDQLVSNGGSSLRDAINRIEHRQIQTEQRERAFLHMHPDMMFELDRHLALRWANGAYLDAFDVDSDCVENYGWYNTISEADRGRVIDQFKNAVTDTRNVTTNAKLIVGMNHENTVNATIAATVMHDSNQKTGGFLVTVKTIQPARKFP